MALLHDAESQPVANVPAGTDEPSVLSHKLYALLATLTTGRSLRLVQRGPNRIGFEAWRQLASENAPQTAGRRFAMLQAVLQPAMGDNPATSEETWNASEHQVNVDEKLATSKLVDDVKISVVLQEAPTKLRDNQLKSDWNKLRAITRAYLDSTKSWIANDFTSDTKERQKGKKAKSDKQDKESATCAERKGTSQETVGHEQTKTEQ